MKLEMDGLLSFPRRKKYKRYASPSVIKESFMKVEPTRWGSSDDIDMFDHDHKSWITVRKKR